MKKNKISLIGTSQGGRKDKIIRLLSSLSCYNDNNLELIFVDQTNNDELHEVFTSYNSSVNYKLIKSDKCSLSKARNIALKYASGNVVGFCDDDAYYNSELILFLSEYDDSSESIISFPVIDQQSMKFYGNRNFPKKDTILSYNGILKHCLSVGTFIIFRNDLSKCELGFNERLGVGAEYGGSEETELFLRLKSSGFNVCFNPDFHVFHDNDPESKLDDIELAKKYRSYAKGYAVVLKKYLFPSRLSLLLEIANISFRSIFALFIKSNKKLYSYRLKGFWEGLLFGRL